ncbi:LEAF RUST 10 DISEASE-RESISTANCE LOCUS RECEPTOR-LIKE PROTEIN KINASE-like 1.2 isoform X2 [Zingiber officinale]|uniref:LEAF RUST 10 DISEASE-RESISTANCE LOCUS RECEPTOR-LIKE PROTEIN KINASE-like 1.2 isoform X2 n=1 Tax=Zingiber officinale TaxID=94328 RepID=UPI001C4ABA52|nr:LEAF RUST 10 DISEASE-RESISTANCE LOCUS RECEPTOR-LIKE PROTEIN KINASE-like 1.2 isoform X2 [Zingiber officinale]
MAAGFRSRSPPPPRLLSLLVLVLVLCLLVLFSVPSRGEYSCPNSTPALCGGVNISYPFWKSSDFLQNNNTYCGYQGFNVTCESPYYTPILLLGNDRYRVLDINYGTGVIILADDAFIISIESESCSRVNHSVTWFSNLSLSYTDNDANLTFLYDCTEDGEWTNNSISCLPPGENYVFRSIPESFTQRCNEIFVSPVLRSHLPTDLGQLRIDYAQALQRGFELNWSGDANRDCTDCQSSGGRCGYNKTNYDLVPACFCSDGKIEQFQCIQTFGSTNPGGGLSGPTYQPLGRRPKHHTGLIIGIAIGAFVVVGLLGGGILFYRYKKKRDYSASMKSFIRSASSGPSSRDPEKYSVHLQSYIFSYDELQEATNGFVNELGDGGFGTVYKGKLQDGRVVAVKRLYENNYRRLEQFMNEIEILSRVRHQNLVDLYGWTSRNSKELLLVYEFMPNGTVADHLHGSRAREGILTLPMRLNIAIETAEALAYLHAIDPPIIHRDVKTSNILLDSSFHVKVADFGLSRLFPTNATHVSTAPQGTPGYLDPEYHQCYQLTDKSDVYSFGVVLVELVSSKPAVDITRPRKEINLANWALNRIQNGELDQLVDEFLGYQSDQAARKTVTMVSEVAFRCLQDDGDMRPPMKEVLEALLAIQSEVCKVSKGGKEPGDNEDDAGLLKNVVPMSPDTVMNQWVSNSTTPNTSKD